MRMLSTRSEHTLGCSQPWLPIAVGSLWLLGAGCSSSPTETDSAVDDDKECVNTFPVDHVHHEMDEHGEGTPPLESHLPTLLSETGLYADIASKEIHPALQQFTPQFQLWSDGAEKQRWVYLPECETVDSSNMDDWSLPVGTRLFKEFAVDGVRVETRIIERLGEGPREFAYASYLWNADESEATLVDAEGLVGAKSTNHDIPSKQACLRCHGSYSFGGGRPSRALGFSALQLSHSESALSLDDLVEAGKLSAPPAEELTVPGDGTTQAALGYLHANCGSCHNSTADRVPQVDLNLWLATGLSSPEESGAWMTAVDQPSLVFNDQHVSGRIVSGNPAESAVYYRMSQRGNNAQMPPLATHTVDAEGLAAVKAWIESLP
jgi:mono/diheme cytochrome c family protein